MTGCGVSDSNSVEFARNVAGLEMANSTEFESDTPHPVIDIMADQVGVDMGGTMRLGRYSCELAPGTLAAEVTRILEQVAGVLVAPGFGPRGVEGKILAARHARERQVPYLGLCYGMQMAVIEFARHVSGLEGANSTEIDPRTGHAIIDLMPDQRDLADMGGTMRLGLYPCRLTPGSRAAKAYGEQIVQERHRHRFEFNNAYREGLAEDGLLVSGTSPDGRLVEIIELRDHPWFVGTQFHPEFKSRPTRPHPLFRDFIEAAVKHQRGQDDEAAVLANGRVALVNAD